MIVEIIKKPGEKGSGGSAEAFKPGARYVCEKADHFEMRNLASRDWEGAAAEMQLVSELNSRVQKPYYHMAASWHALEQPTNAQMMEAADYLLKAMGLEEHQAIIAIHRDKKEAHFHVVVNTVHPVTGKVWSKSNDHLRAEKASREIEVMQGWSHDRGRFDFDVARDGTVTLKPDPAAYEVKTANRDKGKRPKTSGDRKFEKSTGFETFEHSLTDALRARFAQVVSTATDWPALHATLTEMGLRYDKHGSGARITLIGSGEHVKASAFGAKFSIGKMQERFGPFEAPPRPRRSAPEALPTPAASMSGRMSDAVRKQTSASSFKLTLLRRVYCDIHVDPMVASAIKYVALDEVPPRLTLKDTTTILDHGAKVTTSGNTKEARAILIAMAQAKGWSSVTFTGPPDFVRDAALDAARAGLPVFGVPDDVQAACNEILEKQAKEEPRLAATTRKVNAAIQNAVADRDTALAQNDQERANRAAVQVEAVQKALGWQTDAVSDLTPDEGSPLPAPRTVSHPQPAPDADKVAPAKARRIEKTLRENDRSELDHMKAMPIDEIASLGGWSSEPRHKDGHNDPQGVRMRTYTRGSETIKATKKGSVWVWTNNKTGQSGSVIDLWLADNPGSTLGEARKVFRALLGTGTPARSPAAPPAPVQQEPRDHTQARRRWEEAPYVEDQRTYAEDRGISKATLLRFRNQVRAGVFGGIYFAHRNFETGSIQGFEQAWEKDGTRNTARFAKGGIKTVSVLGDPRTATRMVVFEGGLDALALAELESRTDTLYVSTGGGFGLKTGVALQRLSEGRQVLSGFDNDLAGETLHKRLLALLPASERYSPPSRIDESERVCKDWLDVLNAIKVQETIGQRFDGEIANDETSGGDFLEMDLGL
ncbi:MAG: relaxase/mobilization nuclease domain-containing protein [Donghicola eburneus]|nr:relaxase/mobilization nuclease domain-containing protein [Donghicola eburneus]MCI5042526.1 relaxase/mobilization nuclease domain-containing protein [Donghicola eburneus]